MRSVLDAAAGRLFLEGLSHSEGRLRLLLAEGTVGAPEPFTVGETTVEGTRPVIVEADSRRFTVAFSKPVAFHVIDETYTAWDDYEQRDSTQEAIQILSQSRWLEHLHAHHAWAFESVAGLKHYRVWTYDAVIEILAADEPTVETGVGA
jgi:hypothetical protein